MMVNRRVTHRDTASRFRALLFAAKECPQRLRCELTAKRQRRLQKYGSANGLARQGWSPHCFAVVAA